MKLGKRIKPFLLATSVLVAFATPAFASPELVYYSFQYPWGSGSSGPIKTAYFTVTNSQGYVTINGWQDSHNSAAPAYVEYTIKQYGLISDTQYGDTRIGPENYPQNGSWYNYTFTGITPGYQYCLVLTPHNTAGMDGAGNAYDGL